MVKAIKRGDKVIKLTIVKNDEYANYIVEDSSGKSYDVNINFMEIEKPQVGTIIYMDESVLNENVSLNYGPVNNEALKDEKEIMLIVIDGNKKYLQRYYG